MIPLEIFLKDVLTAKIENDLIITVQSWLSTETKRSFIIESLAMIMDLSEVDVLRYTVYALYLGGDAILATKTAIVAFFGEFSLVILKILYQEPRPYWTTPDIKSFRCQNDFEGPSDHMFILMFLGTYLNLIYLRKYAKSQNTLLSIALFILQGTLIVLTMIAGIVHGHTYLYQSIIGIVYGSFFTLVCLQLDTKLYALVEKTIFLQKKARKHKFYMLFFTSGLLVIAATFFNLDLHESNGGRPPNLWISMTKSKCGILALKDQSSMTPNLSLTGNSSLLFLGMKSTFLESAILICVPTLVFATAFALSLDGEADLQQWRVSSNIRMGRIIIGLCLSLVTDWLFLSYPLWNPAFQQSQFASIYFLGYLLPYVLTTFFVYGLTPPLSTAIFGRNLEELDQRLHTQHALSIRKLNNSSSSKSSPFSSQKKQTSSGKSGQSMQSSNNKVVVNLGDLKLSKRDRAGSDLSDLEEFTKKKLFLQRESSKGTSSGGLR